MTDVLIRGIPADDLEPIRAAAADHGLSLQRYLRDVVHASAVYERRQAALLRSADRLRGRPPVPEDERAAGLAAIADANALRAEQLADRLIL